MQSMRSGGILRHASIGGGDFPAFTFESILSERNLLVYNHIVVRGRLTCQRVLHTSMIVDKGIA